MADEQKIAAARADYARDGAARVRGVLSDAWVERMREAVERVIAVPSESAVEYTPQGGAGRYVGDFFVWMRDPDFAALMLDSPLPALAGALMDAAEVRLFYDQLLVKEPLTVEHTPWHQDLPYWPLRGEDVVSIWVALDPVRLETGAVQYAAGSHREGRMYAPTAFGKDSGFAALYARMGLDPFPSEESVRARYDLVCWECAPGDVIIHHPLTFHFSAGNLSPDTRRRAIAVRYLGDDVTFDSRPGTFVEKDTIRNGLLEPIVYEDGQRLGGANFPVAWRAGRA